MKKHNKNKIFVVFMITFTLSAIFCVPVFATGDGSGGGQGAIIPLYMDWSYPANGDSGVSVTPIIQCKFSHNVAQHSVRDRNKTFIHMKKDDETPIDINVFMADAQVEFEKRQYIYVSPVKPLSYGTRYILTLDEGIQAKNNMTTDEPQSIIFTTETGRPALNEPLVTAPVITEIVQQSDDPEISDIKASDVSETYKDGAKYAESMQDSYKEDSNFTEDEVVDNERNTDRLYNDPNVKGNIIYIFLMIIVAVVALLTGIAGTFLYINRKLLLMELFVNKDGNYNIFSKTKKMRVPCLIITSMLFSLIFFDAYSYSVMAAAPESFKVRVLVNDTVVTEKIYTDADLRAMEQTRIIYSGINEDNLPCTVEAEGVLLSKLAEQNGVKQMEIEKISISTTDKWTRNLTRSYLFDVKRYRYPHLSEAYKLENESSENESKSEHDPGDGEENTVEEDLEKPSFEDLRKSDAYTVEPLLALRSENISLSDNVSTQDLSAIEGYRLCFGQLTPTDGAYLMYGYNLNALDIKVNPAGEYAASVGLQDTAGKKVGTPGGADSVGGIHVKGPYKNPFTMETVSELPDSIAINAGYFGTELVSMKTLYFEEIASLPLFRVSYSMRSADGKKGSIAALGVRLVDLLTSAGIDVKSVRNLTFKSINDEMGVSFSGQSLFNVNRYYFSENASRSMVDSLIAIKDYWSENSDLPDFFRMDGKHRYHLVFGQTSIYSDNISKSPMWINAIDVTLEGSPVENTGNIGMEGKLFGSGNGIGGRSGEAEIGSGTEHIKSKVDNEISSETENQEYVSVAGKHVYEISGGSASIDLGGKSHDFVRYIIYISVAVFFMGASTGYFGYRNRIYNLKSN